MDKLNAMRAFAKVVASGGYAEAARRLGLTRSAISKAVLELEAELGVRLLDRTTRRVAPTEAGLAYYERCLAILAQVEETEAQISRLHDEPRGVLKINAPMSFGIRYLGRAIAEFMTRYGELKIEMQLTDRLIDPLEEGVDITIRIGELADSSLIARKLAPARMALVAAPKYLRRRGTPKAPDDLAAHSCLAYGHSTAMQRWRVTANGETVSIPINACLASNNGDVLRDAAIAGVGVARLPTFIVGPDLKSGALRRVLPAHQPADLVIYALYAPNRYLAAKSRIFIDYLVGRFENSPHWDA